MGTKPINTEIPSSFAGALAAFAPERHDGLAHDIADDIAADIADDIAVISYENAIRTQAGFDLPSEDSCTNQPAAPGKKSASITLRMSRAECAQLRKRAAAAGLTLSAYMRSCILDAETLRAQVREALAELRAATPDTPQPVAISANQPTRRWWQPWPHFGARAN